MRSIRNVVCGVSGGVDSAVAALLLKKKGFQVTGAFMLNWDLTNETGECSALQDLEDAEYVCNHLNIPFVTTNFVKEYWNEVFSDMLTEYQAGLTPNPDVLCNKYIKFGHFFHYATTTLKADAVATGHYAQNSWGEFLEHRQQNERAQLMKSFDQHKDQTLFLSQISQDALQKTMFPVGYMTKDIVKQLALSAGLEKIVKKKESTGICFIGKRQFQDFIEEYVEPSPGFFVDLETGEVVGKHKGVHYWTYGQRTHLGGQDRAYFVADFIPEEGKILVVKGTDHPALFSDTMLTGPPHWIADCPSDLTPGGGDFHCQVRYQHTWAPVDCTVRHLAAENGPEAGTLSVRLSRPLRAVARGQYAVLYQGDTCLGSARILSAKPSLYEQRMRRQSEGQVT